MYRNVFQFRTPRQQGRLIVQYLPTMIRLPDRTYIFQQIRQALFPASCAPGTRASLRYRGPGRRYDPPQRKPGHGHECFKNPANLAVALNCGIGSSVLKADVKALDRLQSVRGWNSSCCGEKYRS